MTFIRFSNDKDTLSLYFMTLLKVKDLREFELRNFPWRIFNQNPGLGPKWDACLMRWKRLTVLKCEFLVGYLITSN